MKAQQYYIEFQVDLALTIHSIRGHYTVLHYMALCNSVHNCKVTGISLTSPYKRV